MVFSQNRNNSEELPKRQPIYFETHLVPNDSLYICFISFKIPYNNLLFVRDNGNFKSGLSIAYEIFEKDIFISRVYDLKTVSISDYEKTSDPKLFVEGITSFEIREGNYRISPSILLNNTDIDIKGKPLKIIVDSSQIHRPIVVSNNNNCDSSTIQLSNFQNSIPFSINEYDLLIPFYSNNDFSLKVEIVQGDKTIIEKEINEYELFNKEFVECGDQIIITNKKSKFVKYFRLNYVNKSLKEGDVKVLLKSKLFEFEYDMNVFWNEKPKSLYNTEDAIESMNIIGYKNIADSLLDYSDEEQYSALFNYWNRFDDDNSTSFNEIFYEFYSRIDFIRHEYNSLGKNDGLKTDRGKTYLLFGEPDKIERTYSEIYNVLEIWSYSSLNEKVYFSDKTGTGKFERIK